LDLAWWDAFLFFHALDCFVEVRVFLNTEFLKVLVELIDTVLQFFCRLVQLKVQLILVSLNFAVLEVLHTGDGIRAFLLVFLPVLVTFSHPLIHKLFVLFKFCPFELPRILLHRIYKLIFGLLVAKGFFFELALAIVKDLHLFFETCSSFIVLEGINNRISNFDSFLSNKLSLRAIVRYDFLPDFLDLL